jgi:hypothetical protein
VPAKGINAYHQCLNPLEYQPSGGANLSKLENVALAFELVDQPQTQASCYIYSVGYLNLEFSNGYVKKVDLE